MSVWFTCNLGDAMLAGEPLDHIKELFQAEYEKLNRPKDMVVFVRHESEGRLHCQVVAYFSPASAAIAEALGAHPCPQPAANGLSLLAGSESFRLDLL